MTAPTRIGSWELIAAAQHGDRDAFAQLYQRYDRDVYWFVVSRCGDLVLAEDFTSETFLRAWRRLDSVSDQGRDVGAWLITIARNILFDHWKSSQCRSESGVDTDDLLQDGISAESCTLVNIPRQHTPEEEVIDRIAASARDRLLWDVVTQLSPAQQDCLRYRYVDGLSVSDTAEAMGRQDGAVKALHHRAIRRLTQLLPEDTQ